MESSSCPELSLRVELRPDYPFEFEWSSNRADYRHGSTLQNLDDTFPGRWVGLTLDWLSNIRVSMKLPSLEIFHSYISVIFHSL
ncbi:hypothetical protein J1N35_006802 [Gossypium stocksii]|uniref:Uncharacterized protein n=1 Tax=Gossypium stocksii TaxID=47602 RepID=A0A9D3W516_9ROSI|nr:hypothetical protein J1N35_006802 [Gossypium stocksii]